MDTSNKLNILKNKLKEMESVLIAFSGGVDSTFLLKVAHEALGDKCVAVTIHAMMHSNREIEEAKGFTKALGVKHIVIKIDDFDVKEFIENDEKDVTTVKKLYLRI
ncbi:7-cyano-7-deazaguanine synthase [Paraclostridium benzoelyticum]|uniref:7-cyano-7-deazaguanine synthase n=1 Tax=Paraclostridium benzoelyticum TaxID=1629550 RepID=UPI0031CDA005